MQTQQPIYTTFTCRSELTSLLGDIKGTLWESKDNFKLLMSGTREEEDVTSDLFPVIRRAVPDSTLEPIALQVHK